MKYLLVILVLLCAACNPESSPEGRMNMKMEKLEQKIDSLEAGQKALRDSISIFKRQLDELKKQ